MKEELKKILLRNKRFCPKSLCWNWKKTLTSTGYGQFTYKRKTYYTHRLSYEIFNGEIPISFYVCHTCDNRKCFNPDHLFVGTAMDNFIDMVNKGKCRLGLRGRKRRNQKLYVGQVIDIKKLLHKKVSQREISRQFNINQSTISRIKNKKIWSDIYQHLEI